MAVGITDVDGKDLDERYVRVVNESIKPGMVVAFAANKAPAGFLLCNGATVSRTTYPALFSAIGTTYGSGDGSSTFGLPNLTDKFIQGSGTAGTVKSAGLPNITGQHGGHAYKYGDNLADSQGAFVGTTTGSGGAGKDSNITPVITKFDASKSNAIYGASTTVQPPALTMRYYIKY